MSFNKLVETQLAQIAAAIPVSDSRKIPRQPKISLKSIKMVSMKFGKPLRWVNYDYHLDPPFIAKKEDPGRPAIICSIGPKVFDNAFCDLGASINIMSKVMYDKILGGPLSTACFYSDGGPIYMESRGISQGHLGKNSKQLHPHGLRRSRYGPQ